MDKQAIKEVFEELVKEYENLSEMDCCNWATSEKDHDECAYQVDLFIQGLRSKLNEALK